MIPLGYIALLIFVMLVIFLLYAFPTLLALSLNVSVCVCICMYAWKFIDKNRVPFSRSVSIFEEVV